MFSKEDKKLVLINKKPPSGRFFILSNFSRRQPDNQIKVIGLYFCLVRRLVAHDLAAFFTAVGKDISPLGVRLRPKRAQDSPAGICAVTRENVNVK